MATASELDTASALTPATSHMCAKAFETILDRLRPSLPGPPSLILPKEKGGLFVTWTVQRGRDSHYSLRGCIGTLSPAPIDTAIARYANHAAFNDSRFDAIDESELPTLKVAVSVLSAFEQTDDVYDWEVGVHGIVLSLCGGRYSATYLPDVCSEHRWTKEYCVQSLSEKAGFRKPLTDEILDSSTVTRYQSTKAEMDYIDYLKLIDIQN